MTYQAQSSSEVGCNIKQFSEVGILGHPPTVLFKKKKKKRGGERLRLQSPEVRKCQIYGCCYNPDFYFFKFISFSNPRSE